MLITRKATGFVSCLIERIYIFFDAAKPIRSVETQRKLDKDSRQFVLYELKHCRDSSNVRRRLVKNQLNIERKNAERYECFRKEVLKGGGVAKFPCLLIKHKTGEKQWIYDPVIINLTLDQLAESRTH